MNKPKHIENFQGRSLIRDYDGPLIVAAFSSEHHYREAFKHAADMGIPVEEAEGAYHGLADPLVLILADETFVRYLLSVYAADQESVLTLDPAGPDGQRRAYLVYTDKRPTEGIGLFGEATGTKDGLDGWTQDAAGRLFTVEPYTWY